MIYLIQPLSYKKDVYQIIQNYLHNTYPDEQIKIINNSNISCLNPIDIYFIINDSQKKFWNGIKIAKEIREKNCTSYMILITNHIDYTFIFRTHIAFLAVLDLNNTQIIFEIEQLLDFILSNKDKKY